MITVVIRRLHKLAPPVRHLAEVNECNGDVTPTTERQVFKAITLDGLERCEPGGRDQSELWIRGQVCKSGLCLKGPAWKWRTIRPTILLRDQYQPARRCPQSSPSAPCDT